MITIKSSEQLNELFTALAKAQSDMPVVRKTKINPFFKSKYADHEEMVTATRPCLSKNGLSVIYPSGINIEYGSIMTCRLCHSSGQWIEGAMKVEPAKTDIQSLGSYKSYLARYLYKDITGCVTTDEDDDGESSMPENRSIPNGRGFSDKISLDQIESIEHQLQGYNDLKMSIIKNMKINGLGDITREKHKSVVDWIEKSKTALKSANK